MSYQVIARKWRPKTFNELVGQNHISQTLQNALKADRLHHALLFTGPRGTGKTSTARILAKSLRCPEAQDFIPCNKCAECEDISTGRSLNVIEIDGASNNGVDAIRELRDTVGYMPATGKFKVYIIDEVHMLSTSAFNALLKTLEEPPGHVIFVLATTEVQKIPNTVLSRCQRFDFRRIPSRAISERLADICKAEKVKAEPEALWAIARQGDGSMRDSQSLLDQVITFTGTNLTLKQVTEVLGLTDRSLLLGTLQALVHRDTPAIVEVAKKVFLAGYDPKTFMQDVLEEIRHLVFVKLNAATESALVDLPDSEITELKTLAALLGEEDIHLLFDMALKGANDLPKAQDAKIVLEMLLLRMSAAPRIESLRNIVSSKPIATSAPNHRPSITTANSAPPAAPAQIPTAKAKTTDMPMGLDLSQELIPQWHALVQRIHSVNPMVGAQLENTILASAQDKTLKLVVSEKKKFIFDKLAEPEFRKRVLNYISTFWGPGYSYSIELGAEAAATTPKAFTEKQEQDRQQALRKQIEQHPLVQSAQKVFKTEIKSIKEIK